MASLDQKLWQFCIMKGVRSVHSRHVQTVVSMLVAFVAAVFMVLSFFCCFLLYCLPCGHLFKELTLRADSFYKSKCPSVCPSLRPPVCSLLRHCLNVFFSTSGCLKFKKFGILGEKKLKELVSNQRV